MPGTSLTCRLIIPLVVILIASCANPLNRHTSQEYANNCAEAERNGNFDVAEEACSRALLNVETGGLGDALKSTRTYDLARIKRRLAKFEEAEQLLRDSIRTAESNPAFDNVALARRHVELAVNLAALDRWREGADWLLKIAPVASRFEGSEATFLQEVLMRYAKAMQRTGDEKLAEQFLSIANAAVESR